MQFRASCRGDRLAPGGRRGGLEGQQTADGTFTDVWTFQALPLDTLSTL